MIHAARHACMTTLARHSLACVTGFSVALQFGKEAHLPYATSASSAFNPGLVMCLPPLATVYASHRRELTDRALSPCAAVKAQARVTPLTSLHRPQACLPSGGTSHALLLASASQFGLARLRDVNLKSLRLAGARWGSMSRGSIADMMRVVSTAQLV